MNELTQYINQSGGLQKASKIFNVSYQALQRWLKRGEVPLARVKRVHEITNIPKERLNPNI